MYYRPSNVRGGKINYLTFESISKNSHSVLFCVPPLLVILSLLTFACFAQQPAAPEAAAEEKQFCTVSGKILQADTNEGLSRARVVLINTEDSSAPPFVTLSDGVGTFRFEKLPPA